MKEQVRYRKVNNLWIVEVLSTVVNTWIVQGEWKTEEEAEADAENFK